MVAGAMPVEITGTQVANKDKSGRIETRSPGEGVLIEHETKSAQTIPPPDSRSKRRRRLLMGVLGALVLIAACLFGIPWIREMLTTVSTDDAYVNGRVRLESRNLGLSRMIAIVIAAFTAMGLLLAVLHGIEAAFWAAAYLWVGALDSPAAAILYSADSMATRRASGLALQPHRQMMGALEAADGMLLFGISTAFIFTVMQF